MKFLLVLIVVLFSLTTFAEVKPLGALVPSMCGYNLLESINYPDEACVWYEEKDNGFDTPIVTTQKQGELMFYFVKEIKEVSDTRWEWVAYPMTAEDKNGYLYVGEVDEKAKPVIFHQYKEQNQGKTELVLEGEGPVKVYLEYVMNTESVIIQ